MHSAFLMNFIHIKILQPHQPSNIILIRGARRENGQIILQNGHDLLSLLNSGTVSIGNSSDDDTRTCNTSNSPSILLHRKASFTNVASTTSKLTNDANKFVIQSTTLKNTATITSHNQIAGDTATAVLNGNGIKTNAVLQSGQALKNPAAAASNATLATTIATTTGTTTTIPEGSIIFQQRLNKNGANDGPILLQTLKRVDKSPSILLFRNNQTTGNASTCTLTTTTQNLMKTKSIDNHITMVASHKDDGKIDAKLNAKSTSLNIPLGAGKYCRVILTVALAVGDTLNEFLIEIATNTKSKMKTECHLHTF